MSAAALRTTADDVINLDDYRRMRAGRDSARSAPVTRSSTYPIAAVPGPVWVYWVPVWIW